MNSVYRVWFIFATFLFSCSSAAESTLFVGKDFRVISVNGKHFDSSVQNKASKHRLIGGINKLAIEYRAAFDTANEFELIQSDLLLVSFYATNNKHFVLSYIKPATTRAARLFARNPKVSISDDQGNLVQNSSYFLASKSKAFVSQQTRPSISGQQTLNIRSGQNPKSKPLLATLNAEEQLNFWWHRATLEQRKSFLKKISQE